MASFPAVVPSSMTFSAPEFPVRSNTSLSGVVSRRLFGNRGSRSSLRLSFNNISDTVASEFLNAWNLSKGQLEALVVPSIVFTGASAALASYLQSGGDDLTWHFGEPPQVDRVSPGISNLTVTLEATRDA